MTIEPKMRRKLMVILRVLVSVALVGYVLIKANPATLYQRLLEVSQPLLLLAIGLQLLGIFISALKWWLLLRAAQQPIDYLWSVRTYLIGQFFSNFLPTSIGGDAVRIYRLHRKIGNSALAIASVFVERITGFIALTILGWIALWLNWNRFGDNWPLLWAMISGLLAGSGAFTIALTAPWTVGLFTRLPIPNLLDWRGRLQKLAVSLSQFYSYHSTLLHVMLLSFAYQISWIAVSTVTASALGLPVPDSLVALMVPISDIIGLVPIFFNNLGAREGTYTVLLALVNVPQAGALALSLLVFAVRLIVSLLGGGVLLIESLQPAESQPVNDTAPNSQS